MSFDSNSSYRAVSAGTVQPAAELAGPTGMTERGKAASSCSQHSATAGD